MILLVALAWLVVALVCWIGYQLIRQNGRILLHLDSLEQQIAELKSVGLQPARPAPLPALTGLEVGTIAPAFELPDLVGQQHSLAEWRGRKLLLMFFNPGCGFCQQMAPDIADLAVDDQARPMPLLVSTGSMEENRKMVEAHGLKCPVLLQQGMEVASQYRASGTPIGYLIDEDGQIATEMAVGASGLLALLDEPADEAKHGQHASDVQGNRFKSQDLTRSRIKRDGLPAGTPAPDFRLPRLDGGELALADFRDRKVLLIFSDPGCGPCQQLSARLKDVWSPESDVQILMVSRGDKEANLAKAQEHGLQFPIVLQKQWEISKLYAMFATPVAYLIDEYGTIVSDVATGVEPIMSLLSSARTPAFPKIARTA
jgi:methylamine dehydrogenase accessory protein MauD